MEFTFIGFLALFLTVQYNVRWCDMSPPFQEKQFKMIIHTIILILVNNKIIQIQPWASKFVSQWVSLLSIFEYFVSLICSIFGCIVDGFEGRIFRDVQQSLVYADHDGQLMQLDKTVLSTMYKWQAINNWCSQETGNSFLNGANILTNWRQ